MNERYYVITIQSEAILRTKGIVSLSSFGNTVNETGGGECGSRYRNNYARKLENYELLINVIVLTRYNTRKPTDHFHYQLYNRHTLLIAILNLQKDMDILKATATLLFYTKLY